MSTTEVTQTEPDELRRMTPEEFRDIIGRFASGVTVITATHDDEPKGATASAVSSLSLDPPMVLVCLNKTSSTCQAVSAARRFAVNILGEDQAEEAMRFAKKGADKFAGVALTPGQYGEPLLADALAILECNVKEEVTWWHTLGVPRRGGARIGAVRGPARLLPGPVRTARARAGRECVPQAQGPRTQPGDRDRNAAQPRRPRQAVRSDAQPRLSRTHQIGGRRAGDSRQARRIRRHAVDCRRGPGGVAGARHD